MAPLNGIVLSKKDFDVKNKKITNNNNKPGMILIHATWCGHCVRFHDTWNDIAKSIGKDFSCMSIESEQIDDNLTKMLNFKGFPTIKFVDQRGNIISQYDKQRDKETLLKTICEVYHHCVKRH